MEVHFHAWSPTHGLKNSVGMTCWWRTTRSWSHHTFQRFRWEISRNLQQTQQESSWIAWKKSKCSQITVQSPTDQETHLNGEALVRLSKLRSIQSEWIHWKIKLIFYILLLILIFALFFKNLYNFTWKIDFEKNKAYNSWRKLIWI